MTEPDKPAAPETTELDTSKMVPAGKHAETDDATPIGDEAHKAALDYLKGAQEADLTHFDEDDNPLSNVGDVVEDD